MISDSTITSFRQWLEAVEELPLLSDGETEKARKALKSVGLTIDQVERGGVRYAVRKALDLLTNETQESKE